MTQMWGLRERGVTEGPNFFAWTTGRMELPHPEMRKAV